MLQPDSLPFTARRKLADAGVLIKLRASTNTFHLAGSFYFGVATVDSDVDLYAAFSDELIAELVTFGFRKLGKESPVNNDLSKEDQPYGFAEGYEYTYGVFELITDGAKIHIQVFYDLTLLLHARDILAKVFPAEHTRTRGSNRGEMWHAAVDMVHAIREFDAGGEPAETEAVLAEG